MHSRTRLHALPGSFIGSFIGSLAILFVGCIAPAPTAQHVVRGPLPTRTNGPIVATFLAFRPRGAETVRPGHAELAVASAYSSIFQNGHLVGADVVTDGELWRTSIALRTGLSASSDIEIEVPVVYATSGFLDRFVDNWHHLFQLPNGGRDKRPDFAYEMEVDVGGKEAYRLQDNDLGLGDVPIVYTQRIVDESESSPAVALRAGVELPAGSEPKGFGNGGIDAGGGVLVEKSWDRFTASGGAYYVSTSTARSFANAGVHADDLEQVHAGGEYRWNDALSLLAGLRYTSPVTDDIQMKEIDSGILDLDLGAACDLPGGSRLLFGLTEDVIARSGPDFTMFATWILGF